MIQENRPRKRVVSKKAYARNMGRKASTASAGIVLFVISLVAGLMSIGILTEMTSDVLAHRLPLRLSLLMFVITGLLGSGAIFLIRLGRRAVREAREIDAGVPLTRGNIGNLPVRESLVRASNQPVQEQKTVLLRAATSANTTPAEQLVRAFHEPDQEQETARFSDQPTTFLQEQKTLFSAAAGADTTPVEQWVGASAGNNLA